MNRTYLPRYDVEAGKEHPMAGFLEKLVEVHRRDEIPATLFCTGNALDQYESEFRAFYEEVKNDPLFDLQDHSYSHIGIGYDAGKPVEVLRADYEKSFAAHQRVFGQRPRGISICGTGCDGKRLAGLDCTEKSRAEFDMLAELGVRYLNTCLTGYDENHDFCNYASIGHPEVMGYPSDYSDTDWLRARTHGDPTAYCKGLIDAHASRGQHISIVMHDWCQWTCGPDKELSLTRRFAEYAREKGFQLRTMATCYDDTALWK